MGQLSLKPLAEAREVGVTAFRGAGRESSRLPLGSPDLLPQGELDSIIWRSVYGANSTPPPPGPNAGNDQ